MRGICGECENGLPVSIGLWFRCWLLIPKKFSVGYRAADGEIGSRKAVMLRGWVGDLVAKQTGV